MSLIYKYILIFVCVCVCGGEPESVHKISIRLIQELF